ncbi:MAG: hypothetical protein RR346_01625 [Bacteroidales bacterium]
MILCFLSGITVYSQTDNRFYTAFIQNNPTKWKEAMTTCIPAKSPQEKLLRMEYLYGYIGWCIRDQNKPEGAYYLDLFKKYLKDDILPEYYQQLYLSIAYGYGILLDTEKAMSAGPKSLRAINKAIDLDPENPLGYIQKGNVMLKMPSIFGGSAHKALKYFAKAESLMEKKKNQPIQSWIYLHLLCTMSDLYQQENQCDIAKKYYNKIQAIEPELFWLKNFEKHKKDE